MVKQYIEVLWKHSDASFPIRIFSELDVERYESRKVEVYADGAKVTSGDDIPAFLSDQPVPSLDEMNASGELVAKLISEQDFEEVWCDLVD